MKTTATILALGASALAQTVHQVTVDAQFSPDSLTDVAQGDIIQFNFQGTHSVATSDFSSPCKTGGNPVIYSDNVNAGGVFSIQVNSTNPIWIYCGFANHCSGNGQVMVVNPPSDGSQTLSQYRSAAGSAGSSQNANGVQGGVLADASAFSGSSGSASSSGSSAASSTVSSGGSSASATSTSLNGASLGTASATASKTAASASASGSSAEKLGAFGVAGLAGIFAAIFA